MKMLDPILAGSTAGVTSTLVVNSAIAQATRQNIGPDMMGWHGGWGMFFGPFFMIFWLAVAVAIVVLLVRWLGGPSHTGHSPYITSSPVRTPLDILKERFARGEIDKDEYEERRRILGE